MNRPYSRPEFALEAIFLAKCAAKASSISPPKPQLESPHVFGRAEYEQKLEADLDLFDDEDAWDRIPYFLFVPGNSGVWKQILNTYQFFDFEHAGWVLH